MTGEELKTKLEPLQVSQSEIARRLGMQQQSFNKALKAADVKTGLIEKLAKVLGVELSYFYGLDNKNTVTTHGDNNTVQVGSQNCCMSTTKSDDDDEEIDLGLDDICDLKEEIKYLKDQNKKLMEWIDKLMNK